MSARTELLAGAGLAQIKKEVAFYNEIGYEISKGEYDKWAKTASKGRWIDLRWDEEAIPHEGLYHEMCKMIDDCKKSQSIDDDGIDTLLACLANKYIKD